MGRIEADAWRFTRQRSPLALWHLLSLDAPTVAALWTWFIARSNHVALPLCSVVAMAIAVWMLYAADWLMDARLIRAGYDEMEGRLEARHYFHHLYRSGFLAGIVVASVALAVLLPRLDARAMHLYLVLGGLLAGYFILIHAAWNEAGRRLPKEIAVGVFFAAATFIPAVARREDLRAEMFPGALLFAAVCSLNCLFIYAWEHPGGRAEREASLMTRSALRFLTRLSVAVVVAGVGLAAMRHGALWPVSLACALAVILLLLLHRVRSRMEPVTLRAAADFVLLTPLLLLPLVH